MSQGPDIFYACDRPIGASGRIERLAGGGTYPFDQVRIFFDIVRGAEEMLRGRGVEATQDVRRNRCGYTDRGISATRRVARAEKPAIERGHR